MKVFLSHSSKDKEAVVKPVANWLGKDKIIYDEFTFEVGAKTFDEIINGINSCDIFAFFISESSLQSEWVNKEIILAGEKVLTGKISKFFPVIIDRTIKHNDPRIPPWMQKNYNIKYTNRARLIASRIHTKMIEIHWDRNPINKLINDVYVGRNKEQSEFENRYYDFEKEKPISIFCSGMNGIGRRTFLYKASYKTGLNLSFHKPNFILLDREGSIEDFILKINDLGLIDLDGKILGLTEKSLEQKIKIVHEIIDAAIESNEQIWLIDNGCIVNYKREIHPWFKNIIQSCSNKKTVFLIASQYSVNQSKRPRDEKFHFIDLYELNDNERKWFLSQLNDIEKATLSSDEMRDVCNNLTGLPAHVKYAHNIIAHTPQLNISEKIHLINDFAKEQASAILNDYAGDERALDFIRLLAQFDIISLDFLSRIVELNTFASLIDDLSAKNIIEHLGFDGGIIKISDLIRTHIYRNRILNKDKRTN
jgi:hypothetical protein